MDVTAVVHADSTVTFHEKIEVQAEGREIRRGIVRVLPTDYVGTNGKTYRTSFKLMSATINGKKTKVKTSRVGGNMEIQVGDPGERLRSGVHVFDIAYKTVGWVAFRDAFDEL